MKPKLFYTSLTGPVALYFYTFSGLDELLFGIELRNDFLVLWSIRFWGLIPDLFLSAS